jgi:hypothetical protein
MQLQPSCRHLAQDIAQKMLLAISSRKPVPYYINLTLHPMMIKIEDEAVPCR